MNWFSVIPILLGWLTGWLVNYLADVLPQTLRLSRPACASPQCKAPFRWADYLLLRGCRSCGRRRSLRTYLVQVIAVLAVLSLWIFPPQKMGFILGFCVLTYLVVAAIIDLEQRLVLQPVSVFGLALSLGAGLIMHGWQSTLIGGAAGFGIMFIFYQFGRLFTYLRAKRLEQSQRDDEEALGSGDMTLATILGLLLGWPLIWFNLLMGILLAGIVSLLIIIRLFFRGRYKKEALLVFIPYGPFFIVSAIALLYFPTWISAAA